MAEEVPIVAVRQDRSIYNQRHARLSEFYTLLSIAHVGIFFSSPTLLF